MAELDDVAAQAVSHMKLTFPKKIFEVCHLMKRETEVQFYAQDPAGAFTKEIRIIRLDDDNISISLTVDNLSFEANNLCFCVDKVKAKDEDALQTILEPSQFPANSRSSNEHSSGTFQENSSDLPPSAVTKVTDHNGIVVKRRKQTVGDNNSMNIFDNADLFPGDTENSQGNDKDVTSPKKIGRFNKTLDDEFHQELMTADENQGDSMEQGNFFSASNDAALIGESLISSDTNIQTKDGIPDVHVVVEKRSQKRIARSANLQTDDEQSEKELKPHSSKGKKRPHYKREANIECKVCHNMYKDELSLMSHVQKLHPDSEMTRKYIAELKEQAKVACKICGKILGNKRNEITSHMMRVHGKDDDFISRCEECGAEFRRTFLLKEHIRRQHPKHDRVLCHLCPASFKLKEYLTEHLKYTHNKQFKWQCDICGKMTSSPKNLRRHKKLHDGLSYQCPICDKLFSESGNMRRHILYVHNAQTINKCRCTYCHKDFSTKSNLLEHMNMVHAKTTPFYCDICKKYFSRKKLLIEHAAMVHPGVPILSTTKTDGLTSTGSSALPAINTGADGVLAEDQQAYSTLQTVEGADDQSTIILQGPDGTEHVIMASQALDGHSITVPRLQHELDIRAGDELAQPTHNINMITAGGIADSSLTSLAQQALAAFEAGGGLEGAEFGEEQYLSVIGDDGQEIRVQIVRKDPSDVQPEQQLENIYVQAADTSLNLSDEHQVVQDQPTAATPMSSAVQSDASQPTSSTQIPMDN